MAYVTGTANSMTDLLAAIQTACTANGWTLSGNVLHKNTCYIELAIASGVITIRSGTGIDGSNLLAGAADTPTGQLGISINSIAFGWPVTFQVFIGTVPDEVYVVCNYAVTKYQQVAWGQSAMPGLIGTGNWYSGCSRYSSAYNYIPPNWSGDGQNSQYGNCTSILCQAPGTLAPKARGVDHQLDSATWAVEGAARDWSALYFRQPNIWNAESILIPIRVYANRPSSFVSPVLECAHARFVSVKNLDDGQIITLGPDRWKVFPWWDRVASAYAGHAFRYDGP